MKEGRCEICGKPAVHMLRTIVENLAPDQLVWKEYIPGRVHLFCEEHSPWVFMTSDISLEERPLSIEQMLEQAASHE